MASSNNNQIRHEKKRLQYKKFWENIRKLFIGVFLISLILVLGILGFIIIEGYTFVESFYMTIITISTVGYGEVRPLSENGRLFASFLIITNIAIFTYGVSIVSSFIIEGDFRNMLQDINIQRKINKLSNHVIVCGFGRYGSEIAAHFQQHNIPFVIIENNPTAIQELRNNGEILFIDGDATDEEVLIHAGIERAKSLVSSLPDDAESAFVVLTARRANPKLRIISRAERRKSEQTLKMAGADEVITPENIGGFYMATLVGQPYLVEFFRVMTGQVGGEISLQELSIDTLPKAYINRTIQDLLVAANSGINIIALKMPSGEYIVNPNQDIILQPAMRLIVMGNTNQIKSLRKYWDAILK